MQQGHKKIRIRVCEGVQRIQGTVDSREEPGSADRHVKESKGQEKEVWRKERVVLVSG